MFTRFNGNVVPFADEATSTNRTVFGGVTQSDAIDDNLNTNFKKGWEIVGLNDNPTREDFNAMGYTLGALTAYLYEMGISEWNASQNYRANSIVMASNGNLYKSLTGTSGTPNIGKNPLSDVVNWKSLEAVFLTENQTIAGVKTFSSTIVGNITGNSGSATKLQTARTINGVAFDGSANITVSDSTAVKLTGDQTIAGIKTFSSSPIVPTPTTNTQAANKAYVDSATDRIGMIDYGYVAKDYHIVAFGGEFNRADYPKLWLYLQANPTLVKTQAQWQSEATANGGICGFFSDGNGTTTFRVPNLDKAFLRPDSRGVGSFQEGSYLVGDSTGNTSSTGAIINYNDDTSLFKSRVNWEPLSTVLIGASNLRGSFSISAGIFNYGADPSGFGVARPKNIAVLPLIVAK